MNTPITIKSSSKRPATLANVVDALEAAPTSLNISLATAPQGRVRYAKFDDTWREISATGMVKLRLQFERKGFKPVSNKLLSDALAIAKLPALGGQ